MKKSEATEKRFLYSFNILQLYDAHDFASVWNMKDFSGC